jgi:hypothetical protein
VVALLALVFSRSWVTPTGKPGFSPGNGAVAVLRPLSVQLSTTGWSRRPRHNVNSKCERGFRLSDANLIMIRSWGFGSGFITWYAS